MDLIQEEITSNENSIKDFETKLTDSSLSEMRKEEIKKIVVGFKKRNKELKLKLPKEKTEIKEIAFPLLALAIHSYQIELGKTP